MDSLEEPYRVESSSKILNRVLRDDFLGAMRTNEACARVGESSIGAIRMVSAWLTVMGLTVVELKGVPVAEGMLGKSDVADPLDTLANVAVTVGGLGVIARSLVVQYRLPRSRNRSVYTTSYKVKVDREE